MPGNGASIEARWRAWVFRWGTSGAALSNNYDRRVYRIWMRPMKKVAGRILPSHLSGRADGAEGERSTRPELKLNANTPRTFIAMASDDPVRVENALYYA